MCQNIDYHRDCGLYKNIDHYCRELIFRDLKYKFKIYTFLKKSYIKVSQAWWVSKQCFTFFFSISGCSFCVFVFSGMVELRNLVNLSGEACHSFQSYIYALRSLLHGISLFGQKAIYSWNIQIEICILLHLYDCVCWTEDTSLLSITTQVNNGQMLLSECCDFS